LARRCVEFVKKQRKKLVHIRSIARRIIGQSLGEHTFMRKYTGILRKETEQQAREEYIELLAPLGHPVRIIHDKHIVELPQFVGGIPICLIVRTHAVYLCTGQRQEEIDLFGKLGNRELFVGLELGVCRYKRLEIGNEDKPWFMAQDFIVFTQLIDGMYELLSHFRPEEHFTFIEQLPFILREVIVPLPQSGNRRLGQTKARQKIVYKAIGINFTHQVGQLLLDLGFFHIVLSQKRCLKI